MTDRQTVRQIDRKTDRQIVIKTNDRYTARKREMHLISSELDRHIIDRHIITLSPGTVGVVLQGRLDIKPATAVTSVTSTEITQR